LHDYYFPAFGGKGDQVCQLVPGLINFYALSSHVEIIGALPKHVNEKL